MAQMSDKECMMRAMYFESNRSSPDGMLAVGTVVMNRLYDGRYPKSVCGVVGQKNQFAQGVLTKP
ncbi:MAG: cell wall hydrolase, partial [Hyphomicrobiales bacterium]